MQEPPPSDREMRERLEALDARLRLHSSEPKAESDEERAKKRKGAALAYRVVTEILAGFLVGYFLGKFLDNLLETKPILTIICLLLGMIGAFVNIYKAALR